MSGKPRIQTKTKEWRGRDLVAARMSLSATCEAILISVVVMGSSFEGEVQAFGGFSAEPSEIERDHGIDHRVLPVPAMDGDKALRTVALLRWAVDADLLDSREAFVSYLAQTCALGTEIAERCARFVEGER